MTVETATYISQLNAANPAAGDPKSEGDDHLRLTKSVLQSQFSGLGAAAVTVTAAELNATAGASTPGTGASTFYVANPGTTDSSLRAAPTALVDAKILAAAVAATLPSQTGNADKFVGTDGTTASWKYAPVGYRNRLINGGFSYDQRNRGSAQTITAAAALAYTVDRWYAYCTGANVTGQRVAGTAPDQYLYQFTGAASVTKIGFAQRIEAANIQDLASTTVTLSAYMSNSLLTTVTWVAYYASTADTFGTLASPTRTQIATGTFTVSSTLTRYSTNISLPANAANGVEIEFSVGAQTSGTWKIGRVQLELGSSATAFEVLPLSVTKQLCQSYYYRISASDTSSSNGTIGCGFTNTSTAGRAFITFPVPLRSVPTTLEQSGTASDYRVILGATGSTVCSAVPTFTNAATTGGSIDWSVASGGTANQAVLFAFNASGGYLGWSAEVP